MDMVKVKELVSNMKTLRGKLQLLDDTFHLSHRLDSEIFSLDFDVMLCENDFDDDLESKEMFIKRTEYKYKMAKKVYKQALKDYESMVKFIDNHSHYIEVVFHDNDFGNCFMLGLERVYKDMVSSTDNKFSEDFYRCIREIVEDGRFSKLLMRAILSEYLYQDVEWAFRGFGRNYSGKDEPLKSELNDIEKVTMENMHKDIDDYSKYFNFDVIYHINDKFKTRWQNGEHFYLELNTGKVGSF